ncbi:hypothetical protein ACP4OV_006025 [Aristida adscensionis]
MGALAPAVRSLAGVPRRAAPVASGERALPTKRPRGVEPVACGEMAAKSSSARRVASEKPSVVEPRYVKAIRNGVVVEMEVIAVGGEKGTKPAVRRVESEKSVVPGPKLTKVRRNGVVVVGMQSSVPGPKPSKACRSGVADKKAVLKVDGEVSVGSSPGSLEKRLASELDALHKLLKKAELLSRSKKGRFLAAAPRPEAPMDSGCKAPPAKRRKRTEAPRTSPASEVVQAAEPEKPQHKRIAPTARPITALIAKAEAVLERRRAKETARRELLEVEMAAMPDDRIHPWDMEELGIASFQYVMSTTRSRVASGRRPSCLQQLGLFLKPDADGEEQEQEQKQKQKQKIFRRDAEEIEEGEIV